MSGWFRSQSERPGAPEGAGASAGSPHGEKGIVPFEQGGSRGRAPLSLGPGLFFCALGGAVTASSVSILGPAFMAYGLAPAAQRSLRERVGCLAAALVPALALSVSAGLPSALSVVASCLAVFALGELIARESLTPGAICVLVAVLAAAQLGTDALAAAAHGTTIPALIDALLASYLQQFSGLALEVTSQLQLVAQVIALLWPVAYVTSAVCELLLALAGARLAAGVRAEGEAAPEAGPRARMPRLVDFDLPLWVVAVFVASIAGLAVALTATGAVSEVALAVSANVAMSVRFALAAQGIAVLSWALRSRGVGKAASALAWGAALYLEVQFVVLTVAGLVDVWANFRHLPRGGSVGAGGGAAAAQD